MKSVGDENVMIEILYRDTDRVLEFSVVCEGGSDLVEHGSCPLTTLLS